MSTSADSGHSFRLENLTDEPVHLDVDWVNEMGMPVIQHYMNIIQPNCYDDLILDLSQTQFVTTVNCFVSVGERGAKISRLSWPSNGLVIKGAKGSYSADSLQCYK